MIYCSLLTQQQTALYFIAYLNNLIEILLQPNSIQATEQWLLACSLLPYLQLAEQIYNKDTNTYSLLPELYQLLILSSLQIFYLIIEIIVLKVNQILYKQRSLYIIYTWSQGNIYSRNIGFTYLLNRSTGGFFSHTGKRTPKL